MGQNRSFCESGTSDGGSDPVALILHLGTDRAWHALAANEMRRRGHELVVYASAAELLADEACSVPDLVVIDAATSEVEGLEACVRLRRDPRFAEVPVLMLTNAQDEEAITHAYAAGATDVFIKAAHWTLLAERVKHLCRTARIQHELHRSHHRLARIHRSGRVGTFDFDLASREFHGSAGSFAIFGFDHPRTSITEAEFMGRVLDSHREEMMRASIEGMKRGVPFVLEFPVRPLDGLPMTVRVEADPHLDENGRVTTISGVIRDVSEALRAEQEIERLTSVDGLTGLPNRNRFLTVCSDAIARARLNGHESAVVSIDLDRFGQINESFGQVAGDEVLRLVGERLAGELADLRNGRSGASDCKPIPGLVLARLPGDSFAVLLPVVREASDVRALLERLLASFRRPFAVAGTDCFVSCCAGVALYPRDGDSAGLLLSRAGSALIEAKAQGSQSVRWYVPLVNVDGRARLKLISGLHKAVERGELEMHYQPCVDVTRGVLIGVEALARWRHEGAMVPPTEFIALAEENGLIVRIGEWALREASRQIRQWRDDALPVPKVSVNISTLHFEKLSLAESVRDAIREHRLEPGMLEIELTESFMVRDFDGALGAIHTLRHLGVDLALDDFGTGYSSLSYLTRLPIGKLKIDRSFVRLIGVSEEDEAVVRAIVALGRSLRLQVVAEGVETLAQARALLDMDCRCMQGFLFSRPVPASEVGPVIERVREHSFAGSARRSSPARAAAAIARSAMLQ
ncbi:MAG: putative bifunctional diguanylate cyclase/phosphodiesterase [Gammaproteobacteria bacterium]